MFKKFVNTSRYNKPHGILFLFYPCIWGISLSNNNISDVFFLCIIFFLGASGMRSAGCIWNDFNDKDFDKEIERTKKRDIASGKVNKREILLFVTINLLIGTLPLYFLPKESIILCLYVIPLIILYPFMKRITWWPQLWLGISYNWGLIIGFSSLGNNIFLLEIIFFYLGCVLWTTAYDTVYGYQDILDDERVGVKSTSIKFKKNPKTFLTCNYLLSCCFWITSLYLLEKSLLSILFFIILFCIILLNLYLVDLKKPSECYKFFVNNSFFGFFITLVLAFT